MTTQTVPEPEEIPVAKLTRGTWIQAIDEDGCDHGEAEVLHVEAYQGSAVILYRPRGLSDPRASFFDNATQTVPVLSAERLAEAKAAAERAERIADIRAFADFLEQHPALPVTNIRMQASLNPHGDVWNSGAEGVAEVRRLAGLFDGKVMQDNEHITATREVGATEYVIVAWHKAGRPAEPVVEDERCETCGESMREIQSGRLGHIPGEACAPVDDLGFGYSREQDDPTPVSPARGGPVQTGGVVDGGQLVDETPVGHYEVRGWKGDGPGECGVECACGEATFDGFDSLAEASAQLAFHIEAATSPTGLTKAADESRGPLAGTTPVVTYFSFGYGQIDRDSGRELVGRYVTVVAPTYDGCREAMFASRYENRWSFDYLAGRPSTTEVVSRWTEHEVIVAPGTDPARAEAALKAAAELLVVEPVSEAR
ncbi:hypothetical protein Aph02nite_17050 [Actinoplanes philippinensis]|uniref:Uncharacterized protein n=1 Tax=Actinoplanes philippinensis TaxID=35752 RepID=A0A1I2B8D9_9ACTN|nr:hypothetical protein [Actinoplanes philippinensis]GIE75755.1 hypothetical protein Aph02nite_17050 [Actinoplanes philippinensis]SFE52415.1 hypothetical protein SAMN05421541_102169 [Actinoplanes philippinensis]